MMLLLVHRPQSEKLESLDQPSPTFFNLLASPNRFSLKGIGSSTFPSSDMGSKVIPELKPATDH